MEQQARDSLIGINESELWAMADALRGSTDAAGFVLANDRHDA